MDETQLALAQTVADAYQAITWRAYLNASDILCVACDEGLSTADTFMFIDGIWIEA